MLTSAELFKKTWGERAMLHVGANLIFSMINFSLALFGAILIFIFFNPENLMPTFIIFGMIYFIATILHLVGKTCDTIIRVLLLYYAMTGKMPEQLETADIAKISEK